MMSRMKTTIVALALGALSTGAALADAAAPNPLKVGIAPVYAPLATKEKGKLAGVEVDFANQLAKDLGVKVQFVEVAFSDLIPALLDKRVDVVMSGLSATKERAAQVAFCESYLQVGQMALIRKKDFSRLRDPEQMNTPESRVGVHADTTGSEYAHRELKQAKISEYPSVDKGVAALRAGEIDFFLHDAPTIWRIRGREADKYQDLSGRYTPLTEEHLAWAVREDDPGLRDHLNATLEQWIDAGFVDRVLNRWIPVRKFAIAAE